MSQVTRCPSCGTRFKVVTDQLRISQGWVRCGMCQGVFDASEDLQSMPDESLSVESVSQVSEAHVSVSSGPVAEPQNHPVSVASLSDSSREGAHFDANTALPESSVAEPLPVENLAAETPSAAWRGLEPAQAAVSEKDGLCSSDESQADERSQDQSLAEGEPEGHEPAEQPSLRDEPVVSGGGMAEPLFTDSHGVVPTSVAQDERASEEEKQEPCSGSDEPGFVRQARRKAFWHSTGVRVLLVLGSLVAVAGGGAQYAWHQRDALAAQYPALTPALEHACRLAGCELQARRNIADVVITGSGFKQLVDAQQYQWSLTLENRSDVSVAMPMAELTLTDAQDKPLLRRVIDLTPLGAPRQLKPHEEWSVSVPVQLQDLGSAVAGYRALVFYP